MRHRATGCVEHLGQAVADTWWAGNLCQLLQLNHVRRETETKPEPSPGFPLRAPVWEQSFWHRDSSAAMELDGAESTGSLWAGEEDKTNHLFLSVFFTFLMFSCSFLGKSCTGKDEGEEQWLGLGSGPPKQTLQTERSRLFDFSLGCPGRNVRGQDFLRAKGKIHHCQKQRGG